MAINGWALVVAGVVGAGSLQPARPPRISAAALQRLLEHRLAKPVDVRPLAAFRAGHIPGALHVPLDRLEHAAAAVPREIHDLTVVPYCSRADEAVGLEAAQRLRALGFRDVSVLAGGVPAWVAAGGILVPSDYLSAAPSSARNFLNASSVSTMSWPRIL